MRYLSIDTETTGLNKEKHQVLEIGAIVEDTENLLDYENIPKKNIILYYPEVTGSVYALGLNSEIFKIMGEYEKIKGHAQKVIEFQKEIGSIICPYNEAYIHLHRFLWKNYLTEEERNSLNIKGPQPDYHRIKVNQAGKNVGSFDVPFIERVPRMRDIMEFSIRSIDPANYTVRPNDSALPGTSLSLERAGIKREFKHRALSDSWDMIEILRNCAKGFLYP